MGFIIITHSMQGGENKQNSVGRQKVTKECLDNMLYKQN